MPCVNVNDYKLISKKTDTSKELSFANEKTEQAIFHSLLVNKRRLRLLKEISDRIDSEAEKQDSKRYCSMISLSNS
jgi:hypothetical protein